MPDEPMQNKGSGSNSTGKIMRSQSESLNAGEVKGPIEMSNLPVVNKSLKPAANPNPKSVSNQSSDQKAKRQGLALCG